MSDLATRYKLVEDYLCDYIDSLFADRIACSKEFEPSVAESRAIFIAGTRDPADDQSHISTFSIVFKATAPTRSKALEVVGRINKNFPIYSKNVSNQIVISVVPSYITMPVKTVIDSQKRYVVSATLTATVT